MNVKQNLKYQSTHKAILNTMLALLEEKDVEHITVAEICRRVQINRTTFYLHFKDVPDALAEMEREVNGEFLRIFPQHKPGREDFLRLFRHVQENKAFYASLFRQGAHLSMQSLLFPPEAPTPPVPADWAGAARIEMPLQIEYRNAMFYASLNALVRCWVEHGCQETPEQLCEILERVYQAM